MKDYMVVSFKKGIQLSKNRQWQANQRLVCKTLLEFYQKHGLFRAESPLSNAEYSDDIVIMNSDFTADGDKLYCTGVQKWYDSHDRGQPIEKVTLLEKSLKKIRGQDGEL